MKKIIDKRCGQVLFFPEKKYLPVILLCIVLLSLFVSSGCANKSPVVIDKVVEENTQDKSNGDLNDTENEKEDQTKDKNIVVYVCGAVNNVGVYEISSDSRICDAINAAGGLSGDAAADNINLAMAVSDGEQIRVPFVGEDLSVEVPENGTNNPDAGKINLNTATKEQLMTLSGIGEAKANAIISYREEKGKFSGVEDLKKIEGIKDGVYNKIKDNICVK